MNKETPKPPSDVDSKLSMDQMQIRPDERELYQRAKALLESTRKSWIFRMVASFNSERKLLVSAPSGLVRSCTFQTTRLTPLSLSLSLPLSLLWQLFVLMYLVACSVVFVHFGLTTGNRDWHNMQHVFKHHWFLTRFPVFEAGGVNACLMMIALLPLTMCHFTISRLADTFVSTFIPMKRLRK